MNLRIKINFLIFVFFLFLSGCEKETGDVIPALVDNPYQGSYTFRVYGGVEGSTSIIVNNRGGFSFFIRLNSTAGYVVTVTGIVYENGYLEGNIFKVQQECGQIRGEINSGDFIIEDEFGVINARYTTTLN